MTEQHTHLFEVRAALGEPGCPLCGLAQRSLRRYLSALMFEGVTDGRLRDRIRAAYGFCPSHGRMLRQGREALGSAIIHRDILANLARALPGEAPEPPSHGARIRRALRPHAPHGRRPLPASAGCPACERVRESEHRYAAIFAAALAEPDVLAAFRGSSGLCLPHLRQVLHRADGEAHERLRAAQAEIWGRLIEELDEFIRKQDHRFQHEPSGAEADSWRRAIDLVSGQPESDGTERRHQE